MSKKYLRENKAIIANQLFHALAECNLADADGYDEVTDKWIYQNDIPADCSRQDNAYGHIANAIKCLGYEKEYNEFTETGDTPDIREVK